MRYFLYILCFLPLTVFSQTPGTNYVKTTTYNQPYTVSPINEAPGDRQTQVIYHDGLGRPIQTVLSSAGSGNQDIVTPTEYDPYSRQIKEYLPYPAVNSTGVIAPYYPNVVGNLQSFYNTSKYEFTLNPYSEKRLEDSPMGRIKEQASPGNAWRLRIADNNYEQILTGSQILSCSAPSQQSANGSVKIENNILTIRIVSNEHLTAGLTTGQLIGCNFSSGILLSTPIALPDLTLGIIKDKQGLPTGYKAMLIGGVLKFVPVNPGEYPPLLTFNATFTSDLNWFFWNGHSVKYDYQTNGVHEVRRFIVNFLPTTSTPVVPDTEAPKLATTGFYAARQLYKSIVKDENWTKADGKNKTTEEFTDKAGKIVLKRLYSNGQAHDTYYVYDKFSNLTYVIPPLASDAIVNTGLTIANTGKNYPWTLLMNVPLSLANQYDAAIASYSNAEILNLDLMSQYGGRGGFSVIPGTDGNIIFSLNVVTNDTLSLRDGMLIDLNGLGNFSNKELGRVKGAGYEYIFTITGNAIYVSGSGQLSSLNATLTGETPLDYSQNYPWTKILVADAKHASDYESSIAVLDNSQILTTYTPNIYGASGGLAISIDEDDTISVAINISSTTPMEIVNGVIIPLNIERRIANRTLGYLTGSGYNYKLEIIDNGLTITGSGLFTEAIFIRSEASISIYDINQEVVDGLCYIYHYDYRNRVVEKHIPGAGWTHMVYDRLDRIILTQDENLRNRSTSAWLFTKYDAFDRVAYTGEYSNQKNRQSIQDGSNNTLSPLSETKSASPYNGIGIDVHYTNVAFPYHNIIVYAINYYDNYEFDLAGITVPPIYIATDPGTSKTKSLATGSKIKVLGTTHWITAVSAFDKKALPVWSHIKNPYLESEDVVENSYSFTAQNIGQLKRHVKAGQPDIVLQDTFDYDKMGRLLRHIQMNQASGISELLSFSKYDELGVCDQKKVGGSSTALNYAQAAPLQTIDLSYNIRGWLKGINGDYVNAPLINHLFAFKINYTEPEIDGTALFNGNISETAWRSRTDNKKRGYAYTYDAMNRLTMAQFWSTDPAGSPDFSEGGIIYDKNGNIQRLRRWGGRYNNTAAVLIDDLSYSYEPFSNKLKRVTDATGLVPGFSNSGTGYNDDYKYDLNGNLLKDLNKKIGEVLATETIYNHLNLPVKVMHSADEYIEYVYDATGRKLNKRVLMLANNVSSEIITQYDNGFVYKNDTGFNALQYFSHPEGYVEVGPIANGLFSTFKYVYNYKDHLGNTRLSYGRNETLLYQSSPGVSPGGFVSTTSGGAVNSGTYNGLSQVRIGTMAAWSGGGRVLGYNITAGTKYKVSITVDKGTSSDIRISAGESGGGLFNNLYMGTITQSGIYEFEFTALGQFVNSASPSTLSIRLDNGGVASSSLKYFYISQLKIDIGAIRVIEESNYYPFGLQHKGYNAVVTSTNIGQKIKYNGKEFQDELGLNWYDYQARNYDPAIGRWFNIDPLAEVSRRWSPYTYALDNPVYFIDPDGMMASDGDHKDVPDLSTMDSGGGSTIDPPKKKKAPNGPNRENNYYNPKTGNTDGLAWFVDQISSLFTPSKPQKKIRSNKDIGTTVTSKKGGGENPTTTGKNKGGYIEVDAFLIGAPGAAKDGNKYSKAKDFLTYVKDLTTGDKKTTKTVETGREGVTDIIRAVKPDSITVLTYEQGKLVKDERKAREDVD